MPAPHVTMSASQALMAAAALAVVSSAGDPCILRNIRREIAGDIAVDFLLWFAFWLVSWPVLLLAFTTAIVYGLAPAALWVELTNFAARVTYAETPGLAPKNACCECFAIGRNDDLHLDGEQVGRLSGCLVPGKVSLSDKVVFVSNANVSICIHGA